MSIKKWLSSFIVSIFILSSIPVFAGATTTTSTYDIVALGDSLAAGMNENGDIGKGYADFLADLLNERESLNSFNKGFSNPGYRTTNILNDFKEDVVKPKLNQNLEYGENIALSQAIEEAEIVTLSIGANDILAHLKRNDDGTFTFDIATVLASINSVSDNIKTILTNIKQLNEDVIIVVMGYYNPFPTETSMAFELNYLVSELDKKIGAVVNEKDGLFVEVRSEIADNAAKYLPNPKNIHLSEEGYKAVGTKMYNALQLPPYEPFVLPKDVSSNFWGAPYIEKAMKQGVYKGYPDGTFKPNKEIKRIEMTSLIARNFKLPDSSKTLPFKDVTGVSQEMLKELQAVYDSSIVKGDGTGKFKPNSNITREQFALIMLRTHEMLTNTTFTPTGSSNFTDIKNLKPESTKAIQFLESYGLVDKVSKFNPKNSLTRAQAAKILVLYSELVK